MPPMRKTVTVLCLFLSLLLVSCTTTEKVIEPASLPNLPDSQTLIQAYKMVLFHVSNQSVDPTCTLIAEDRSILLSEGMAPLLDAQTTIPLLDRMVDDWVAAVTIICEHTVMMIPEYLVTPIASMTIADPERLFEPHSPSLTSLLKTYTQTTIYDLILPIITEAYATEAQEKEDRITAFYTIWRDGISKLSSLTGEPIPPLLTANAPEHIANVITTQYFTVMEERERLIRDNPVIFGNDLLIEVFGI